MIYWPDWLLILLNGCTTEQIAKCTLVILEILDFTTISHMIQGHPASRSLCMLCSVSRQGWRSAAIMQVRPKGKENNQARHGVQAVSRESLEPQEHGSDLLTDG
jgi:hypothetical protein